MIQLLSDQLDIHFLILIQRLNTGPGTQTDKKMVRPGRYIIDQGCWQNWSNSMRPLLVRKDESDE